MTKGTRSTARIRFSGWVLLAALPILSGCTSEPGNSPRRLTSGYHGQSTADATCIREHEMRHEPLPLSTHDCGIRFPDLTDEPDLQRRATLAGQPYIATALGRDGQDHWYLCSLTGLHPGDFPSSTSPFRCHWLGVASPHRSTLSTPS